MAGIGYWSVALTFAVSAYVFVASSLLALRGNRALAASVRSGIFVAAAWSTVASGALMHLLLSRDFSVKYVFEHVSARLSTVYTASAFWAGQEGSLLLWLWFLALFTAVTATRSQIGRQEYGTHALAVMSFVQAFLALTLLTASNPFQVLSTTPADGRGLNPLLENLWMAVHPPVVFVGYAAYTVPFALAVAGLITGNLGNRWAKELRRWALLAWLFLGAGILMGARWAYIELGWGGYWGWDPVENSSLVPWLTGTALLHSLTLRQRRRAARAWQLWLASLTFVLCVFATFVTRSGIVRSVHAFSRSPVGHHFIALILLCLSALVALLYWRRRELGGQRAAAALFSRDAGLLGTNLLLLGMALSVFVGTIFPVLSEALWGRQVALRMSFYERTVGPLALLVVFLVGVCPWLARGQREVAALRLVVGLPVLAASATAVTIFFLGAREPVALVSFSICAFTVASILMALVHQATARWRGTHGTFALELRALLGRNRVHYGARITHLGIALIAVGVTGSSVYQRQEHLTLAPGESAQIQGHVLKYLDFVSETTLSAERLTATLGVLRRGAQIATLRPEMDLHWNTEQWITEVAVHTTLREDLYIIPIGFERDGLAAFRVLVIPLVAWIWVGGGMLLLGGLLAWWPSFSGEKEG